MLRVRDVQTPSPSPAHRRAVLCFAVVVVATTKPPPMHAIFTVVLPVFALIAAGYLAGRGNLLGGGAADALNSFVYYFSLPALFFNALAQTPLADVAAVGAPFALSFLGGAAVCALLSVTVARALFHRAPGMLTMNGASAVFANTGYMGIPLLQIALGERGVLAAVIGTMLTAVLFMTLMIVLLETARARDGRLRGLALAARSMTGLVRSPLLTSAAAGVAWSALNLPMPEALGNFTALLAATAGPCALFAMGLFMVGKPVVGLREVAVVCALKLLLMPAITAWLAFGVFAMDAWWAAAVTLLAALPTGSLVFVTAHRYQVYVTEAASVILCSTVLSVVTLSAALVWLGV